MEWPFGEVESKHQGSRIEGQYGCLFEICGHDMKVRSVRTSMYFFFN